jgi:hypothetical protein
MTDDTADKIAKLEAEVAALKDKVSPPKSVFVPMSDAEWIDQMHQLREGRMNFATPPSVVREMNVLDDALCAGIRGDARAPTGRSGIIPDQQPTNVRGSAGAGTGYVDPRPLTNPPGTNWVDAIAIADDVRQRAERKRKTSEE